jgi:hypothetical protein
VIIVFRFPSLDVNVSTEHAVDPPVRLRSEGPLMRSGWRAPAAAETQKSRRGALLQSVGNALAESDRLRRERERLAEECVRLNTEIARLADDNEDLRASAELWIWLYEMQLARANAAIRQLKTQQQV